MREKETKAMRDVLIEGIYEHMRSNERIFFLSADLGSPTLDKIRKNFKARFMNVGIAEQNLINISAGLALEGFVVYAYAITPFLVMRAYEQIRTSLSLLAESKKININLIGLGAGLSYDLSGPTHHSLEDLSIMRTLPNLIIFSPSDWILARRFVDYSIQKAGPKYVRLDGQPLRPIYASTDRIRIEDGFMEIKRGKRSCLISTGYMTHRAIEVADLLKGSGLDIGVVDIFLIKPLKAKGLLRTIKHYVNIVTLEEGFVGKGGLDCLISTMLRDYEVDNISVKSVGFRDKHIFEIGDRAYLHSLNRLDADSIAETVKGITLGKTRDAA